MKIKIKDLPFRNNVAGIIFKNGKFLLLQREDWSSNHWKFPQGGVDKGESDEEAIKREILEEVGNDKFEIVGKSQIANIYDWDNYTIEKAGFKWRGQYQKFYLIKFLGEYDDLNLASEIKLYKWVDIDELKSHIDHTEKNYTNYYKSVMKVIGEFKELEDFNN